MVNRRQIKASYKATGKGEERGTIPCGSSQNAKKESKPSVSKKSGHETSESKHKGRPLDTTLGVHISEEIWNSLPSKTKQYIQTAKDPKRKKRKAKAVKVDKVLDSNERSSHEGFHRQQGSHRRTLSFLS